MKSNLLFTALSSLFFLAYGSSRDHGVKQDVPSESVTVQQRAVINSLSGDPKYSSIPNAQAWYDNSGNPIDSHGGGFIKVNDWYYWVGESKKEDLGAPWNEIHVNMYKSTDLMNWDYVGPVLSRYTPDVSGKRPLTYCKIERPKIIFNAKTKKYVLWAHWEEKASYSPSRVIVATSNNIEGPYTVTKKNSFRPGEGNQDETAMGDRAGGLLEDYSATPVTTGNTSRPYKPISGMDYPPRALQYADFNIKNPDDVVYLNQSHKYGTAQRGTSGTYELTDVHFDLTVKLISVKMTPWDRTYYDMYSPYWKIDASTYVVRYPTEERSEVTTFGFVMGDPGDARTALVKPDIRPGLDESASDGSVLVHSGDAAFLTCNTTDSTIYYTTDGSTPSISSSQYWSGTRISVQGMEGTKLTIKAVCAHNNETSEVASRTYTVVSNSTHVPVFRPFLSIPPGIYKPNDTAFASKSIKIYCPSYNTECYYTMDGNDPKPNMRGDNIGYRSRDETIWVDPKDDAAYPITASDNVYMRLWKLSEDYTDVMPDMEYDVFTRQSREAPALIRHGGKTGEYVYLLTSTQSGWYPNQAMFVRTKDVTTGLSAARDPVTGYRNGNAAWSDLIPFANPSTFYSQPTFIIDISKNGSGPYIYVGDQWNAAELWNSRYVFLPLPINDTGVPVTGAQGTGSIDVVYNPYPGIDVAEGSVAEPKWKLLSLNKPVNATPPASLTDEQIASGTYDYSPERANDGIDYDINVNDDIQEYYKPSRVPYYWQVDLEKEYSMSWIGLSFMSVGGSDAVARYTITGSRDGSYFYPLVDNTANSNPGYRAHDLTGNFRYIRVEVHSVYDVIHGKEADWEAAVYEISVYGTDADDTLTTTSPVSSTSQTPSSTTQPPSSTTASMKCNHDNCLRQFLGSTAVVGSFCATYTQALQTTTTSLPAFVSQCKQDTSRISSACSCLAAPTA